MSATRHLEELNCQQAALPSPGPAERRARASRRKRREVRQKLLSGCKLSRLRPGDSSTPELDGLSCKQTERTGTAQADDSQLRSGPICLRKTSDADACQQHAPLFRGQVQLDEAQWASDSCQESFSRDGGSLLPVYCPVAPSHWVSTGVQDEGSSQDDIDLALWIASNRPVRPAGWATMSGLTATFSNDSISCSDTTYDMPCTLPAAPAHQDHARHVSFNLPAISMQPMDNINGDLILGDILPDVPEGTESVDLLGLHIPIGPWSLPDIPHSF
ncbi:hypothetical protein WJX84_001172 [Apatococcus fuscideae]|uniref:Uncharacterized protein n=1 Tax=Apatococcus fuscideae TaxID=2026836 RepID=A0AAW1SQW6_9CHLO